jgi:hypothetical protein
LGYNHFLNRFSHAFHSRPAQVSRPQKNNFLTPRRLYFRRGTQCKDFIETCFETFVEERSPARVKFAIEGRGAETRWMSARHFLLFAN